MGPWSDSGFGLLKGEFEVAGVIAAVEGLAAGMGLRPGDELLAVNGYPVRDVIDVHFHAAETRLELLIRRDGELWQYEAGREPGAHLELSGPDSADGLQSGQSAVPPALGLTFEHPTFDTEIRRCNNHCPFCFVDQMPPRRHVTRAERGFRPSLYVKDDDYRYSFMQGNYVTLGNLSERDWERIALQRLSPLYVSVHATEPELRRRLLGNPAAPDVMEQLRRLAGFDIEVHTQLVILPGVNDGAHLERSVEDLAGLWPSVQTASIVPVGLTRFRPAAKGRVTVRSNTAVEARAVVNSVGRWQEQFLVSLGDRFVYAADEWHLLAGQPAPPQDHCPALDALRENGVGLVRQFLDDWDATRRQITLDERPLEWPHRAAIFVTGTLFAPPLRTAAAEFAELIGLEVEVRPVVNAILGETVTVAGLLTGEDIVDALGDLRAGEVAVLPRVAFRGPGQATLDGMTRGEIEAALGRPVVLAACMSELWERLRSDSQLSS